MRSRLTPIIRRVQQMIDHVRENLDDEEYDLFLDLIVPEPERVTEKPKPRKPKKILHCDACDYTKRHKVHKDSRVVGYHEFQSPKSAAKSKRAKSLGEAIQKVTKVIVDTANSDGEYCAICAEAPDHNLHHLQDLPNYHEFVEDVEEKSHALAAGEGS